MSFDGTRYRVKQSNVERFWKYVTKGSEDECWEWHGCIKNDYGSFWIRDSGYKNGGRMIASHRYSYMLANNPQNDEAWEEAFKKKILHHECENKLCVNPKHLAEMDSFGRHTTDHHPTTPPAINKIKTHCIRGHEFTPENTAIDKNGKRKCKTCEREYIKKSKKLRIFRGELKY